MKASFIPPDPPLLGKAPTLSLMCLYQRSQTSFEGAVGQTGGCSQEMLDLRRVQHWEQQLRLSTQGTAPAPPPPRAERDIPEGPAAAVLGGC